MRAIVLSLLIIDLAAVPVVLSDEKQDVPARMARSISVHEFGSLDVKRTEKRDLPIFGSNRDWRLERKGDNWLISVRVEDSDANRSFLGFATTQSPKSQQELVVLKKEPDESCLWNLVFEEKKPNISSRFCYATATTGDFRGWFLVPGDPVTVKNESVLERSVTLAKEKSEKTRLRLWVDGK